MYQSFLIVICVTDCDVLINDLPIQSQQTHIESYIEHAHYNDAYTNHILVNHCLSQQIIVKTACQVFFNYILNVISRYLRCYIPARIV
jgi:hypothetical protein